MRPQAVTLDGLSRAAHAVLFRRGGLPQGSHLVRRANNAGASVGLGALNVLT